MPLLRSGQYAIDEWTSLDDGCERPADGDIIVSQQRIVEERDLFDVHRGRIGVALASDDSLELIVGDLARIALIALDFTSFVDGRHYSNAALLRERYHFAGEIRARGEVSRDQALFLKRSGCDAIVVADDVDVGAFARAFSDFSVFYQYAQDPNTPAYRLRAASH